MNAEGSVLDWLSETARRHPDQLALRLASGEEWTWDTLRHHAMALADLLAKQGVCAGNHVAWLGYNAGLGIPLMAALGLLGAVFVPLNTRLTPTELDTQIRLAGATLIACEDVTAGVISALECGPPTFRVDRADTSARMPAQAFKRPPLDSVQSIVFTSGTTGTPKGAQITWSNQLASAQASADRIGSSADDRWLLTLPLYHVGGMTIPFRAALSGAAVVEYEPGQSFSANRLMAALHEHDITHVSLVPTMLHRLLEAKFTGAPHLHCILLGGAAAAPDLLERAFERGLPIAPTYGLTEACSQVATLPPDEAPLKIGSVGRPLRGTTVTILREDGASAAAGEVGEIVVRGPTIFAGYVNAANDRALRDGALYTGDMGYLDLNGYLYPVQRRTDLILTGGENVYPAEVETVLRAHPDVRDVCVVGVPHPEWGQQVAAALVLESEAAFDATALDNWCRERLAGYKRPRQLRVVNNLPATATGKILRREVAALFATTPDPESDSG